MKIIMKRIAAFTLIAAMALNSVPAMTAWADGGDGDIPGGAAWSEISETVGQYYGYTETASVLAASVNIPDGALLGNGDVGVASGGTETEKMFRISKSDYWSAQGSMQSKPQAIGGVTITTPVTVVERNLAKNKAVIACQENVDQGVTAYGRLAVDGLENTKWCATDGASGHTHSGGLVDNHFLIVDLGEVKNLGSYTLKLAGYAGENNHNAYAWRLQVLESAASGVPEAGDVDLNAFKNSGTYDARWKTVNTVTSNTNNTAGRLKEITLANASAARYVRLVFDVASMDGGTSPGTGNTAARVHELELYETNAGEVEAARGNIALPSLYKAVTASGQLNTSLTPDKAVDGLGAKGREGWVTANAGDQWIQLEYEKAQTIYYYFWGDDHWCRGSTDRATGAWQFQYKMEAGDEWKTADSVSGNTSGASGYYRPLDKPVTGKFFRLFITQPTQAQTGGMAAVARWELWNRMPPYFREKQNILDPSIETEMQIGDTVPAKMETWLTANADHDVQANEANFVITKIDPDDDSAPVSLRAETWAYATTNAGVSNSSTPVTAVKDSERIRITRNTVTPGSNYNSLGSSGGGVKNGWISQAALSTKIIGASVTIDNIQADNATGKAYIDFTIPAGETAYVVTAVGGGGRTWVYDGSGYTRVNSPANKNPALYPADSYDEGFEKLPTVWADDMLALIKNESDIDRLRADTTGWWKDFWSESYIKINGDGGNEDLNRIQRYYYGAQYILGSTSRAGFTAPGLFGVWRSNDVPSWQGDWHLNYNFISTFYGSYSSNHAQQSLPASEAILSYLPTAQSYAERPGAMQSVQTNGGTPPYGQTNSTNNGSGSYIQTRIANPNDPLYGSNGSVPGGVLMAVGAGPWGSTSDTNQHNQTLNAAFSAYPLIQQWEYYRDGDFLENTLYPYLKSVATFCEAWAEPVPGEAGKFRILAGFDEGTWSLNPAAELAAYKYVLRYAILSSEMLDIQDDHREEWQTLLDGLADQPTQQYTGGRLTGTQTIYSLAEQEYASNTWRPRTALKDDRNMLVLETVIPGGLLGYYSDPESLQIAYNTILAHETTAANRGDAWMRINNFPKTPPVAVRTRYPAADFVSTFARVISDQILPASLRVSDHAHGVEKCGATEAVNGMLLVSDKGVIKVFPNWINEDAKFDRLREKGAFVISSRYDGASKSVEYIKLESEAGGPATLASPWEEGVTVTDQTGAKIPVTKGTVPNYPDEITFSFDTQPNMTYMITRSAAVDKSRLDALIAQAEALNGDDYLAEDWAAFEEALGAAKTVSESEDATQDDVEEAADALESAIGALTEMVPVASIKINSAATTTVRKNKTLQLGVIYTPAEANFGKEITWSSSNEASVKVDAETGLITGVKAGGSARVTATSSNGKTYTITVTVDS